MSRKGDGQQLVRILDSSCRAHMAYLLKRQDHWRVNRVSSCSLCFAGRWY